MACQFGMVEIILNRPAIAQLLDLNQSRETLRALIKADVEQRIKSH
jgi:hypothetical protein